MIAVLGTDISGISQVVSIVLRCWPAASCPDEEPVIAVAISDEELGFVKFLVMSWLYLVRLH